jgi:iron complex outermembrane receptor protein
VFTFLVPPIAFPLFPFINFKTKKMKKFLGTMLLVTACQNLFAQSIQKDSVQLPPLEVRAIRASERAPFAKQNLTKSDIQKNNVGPDLPFLLNQTPSVVVQSDAGNGIGYTGIRIRGTDATRINVTINGVAYNDAESMGTFLVNLPDFASSVSSIQIQRGVGSSSNGPSAFGASINLSTHELNDKAYFSTSNSAGSFGTLKNTLQFGSGLLKNHFTIDARLSSITSDGYIDRATSNLKSYYASGAYLAGKSSIRFTTFSGKEKTYQAWYGVSASELANNRTFNPAGTEKSGEPYNNQTDNYKQTHYQLFFNHQIANNLDLQITSYYTKGAGYYEEYKAGQSLSNYNIPTITIYPTINIQSDLVRRRWLDNNFYGQNMSLQYRYKDEEIVFGGGWSTYMGKHFGRVKWIEKLTIPGPFTYYDLPALKKEANIYAKWQHSWASNFSSYIDLQYRNVRHQMDGFQNNPTLYINRNFGFFNPKIGYQYNKNGWVHYASFSIGQKEPNREDFETGTAAQPKKEQLQYVEMGLEKRNKKTIWTANVYYMNYKDQLVLTGQINDVGAYTRMNVPNSYRLGLELSHNTILSSKLQLSSNITISKNKIKSFTEYIDNYDTGNQDATTRNKTDIAFSPNFIAASTLAYKPTKALRVELQTKWVGKQYLDNSSLQERSLDAFANQDISASYEFAKNNSRSFLLTARVNNISNQKYVPNGYSYAYVYGGETITENGYYPMATINYLIGLTIKF